MKITAIFWYFDTTFRFQFKGWYKFLHLDTLDSRLEYSFVWDWLQWELFASEL